MAIAERTYNQTTNIIGPEFQLNPGGKPPVLLAPGRNPRELLERMVLRQRDYESRFEQTGNDVLAAHLDSTRPYIIASPDTLPDQLSPNRKILSAFNSTHNEVATAVFLDTVQKPGDRKVLQDRIKDIKENSEGFIPLVYGTSGTELNSKELGNSLGAVYWVNQQDRQAVGIYFVEDRGHPINTALTQEMDMLVPFVAASKKVGADIAKGIVRDALSLLYQTRDESDYYPLSEHFQNILDGINPEDKAKVVDTFSKYDQAIVTSDEHTNLAVTAANLRCPTPQAVREAYSKMGFPENLVEDMASIAERILEDRVSFPNPNLADFRTVLQGFVGLYLSYQGYSAESMPLWAVVTWSDLCKTTGVKNDLLTVAEAKTTVEENYPGLNRRVVNFACPSCRSEHGIHTSEQETTACNFSTIAPILEKIPLASWRWGGNSGVMYYELLIKMREGGDFIFFADNYEANGVQTRLCNAEIPPHLLPPKTRTWVVGPNMIFKKHGVVDPDATLGAPLSSELALAYLQTLAESQRQETIQRWFEVSGEGGLDNNCGVLKIDHGQAEIKIMPYDLLRQWRTVSPSTRFDDSTSQPLTIKELRDSFATLIDTGQLDNAEVAEVNRSIESLRAELASLVYSYDHSESAIEAIKGKLRAVDSPFENVMRLKRRLRLEIILRERERLSQRVFKNSDFVNRTLAENPEALVADQAALQIAANEVIKIWQEDGLKSFEDEYDHFSQISSKLMSQALALAQALSGHELRVSDDTDKVISELQTYFNQFTGKYPDVGFLRKEVKLFDDKHIQQTVNFLRGKIKDKYGKLADSQFNAQVNKLAETDTEYQNALHDYLFLKEQLDTDRLRHDQDGLFAQNKARGEKIARLKREIEVLERNRDQLVWQVLTSMAVRVGHRFHEVPQNGKI